MTPDCKVVKVVDGKGRPIVDARVSLSRCGYDATICLDVPVWSTDRSGRVCADELIASTGYLEVNAPDRLGGRCVASKRWEYPRGLPQVRGSGPILVQLDSPALSRVPLHGRITSAQGRPIKGATIAIRSIVTGKGCSFSPGAPAATSSAAGRFSFPSIPTGKAVLRISHPDFAPQLVERTASATADVVLDEGAAWRGRVVDPDGEPVLDCRVFASAGGDVVAESACSAGRFSIQHLPPGDLQVVISTDERSRLGQRGLTIKARITAGERREQDISWPKGATIAGVIADGTGAAIAGARLSATPGRPALGSTVVVRADASGRFAFRHLAPGPWRIVGDVRSPSQAKLDVDAKTDRDDLKLTVTAPKERH